MKRKQKTNSRNNRKSLSWLPTAMAPFITEYPQFFTATNLEWKKLLKPDRYKDIVISSLRFLVTDKRAKIFAFVIMENHIRLI
jgi:REP element-mobilizing transposase RayT